MFNETEEFFIKDYHEFFTSNFDGTVDDGKKYIEDYSPVIACLDYEDYKKRFTHFKDDKSDCLKLFPYEGDKFSYKDCGKATLGFIVVKNGKFQTAYTVTMQQIGVAMNGVVINKDEDESKDEDFEALKDWIRGSYNTNEFVERSLLVDAIMYLKQDEPDVKNALHRLFELTPLYGSHLIDAPEWAVEIENE